MPTLDRGPKGLEVYSQGGGGFSRPYDGKLDLPYHAASPALPPSTLLNNLVSWWDMNEASGTRVDSHGGHNLASSGVGSAAGHVHPLAANFARADLAYLQRSAAPYAAADGTVALWIRPNSVSWGTAQYTFHIGTTHAAKLDFYYSNALMAFRVNNDTTHSGINALTVGWHLVIGDWVAATNTARLFFDNGAPLTATGNYPGLTGEGELNVGRQWTSQIDYNRLDGRLGPVAFWSRTLTSEERAELWNDGAGIGYSSLNAPT